MTYLTQNNFSSESKNEINEIQVFLSENQNSQEALEFVIEAMKQMNGINKSFDLKRSFKSPAFINLTSIDTTTEEGKLFLCVFDKLTKSGSFQELFENTFSQDSRINVCFQIGQLSGANGTTQLQTISNNTETFYNNTITISQGLLDGTNSSFEISKTIIHELIHAYLNVLNTECTNYCNNCVLNGGDLPTVIDEFYQNTCSVAPNSQGAYVSQSEHAFMFDYMIPAFVSIFEETRDLLSDQSSIDNLNNQSYSNETYEVNFDWEEFYYYFSLSGLHTNNAFQDEISSDPYKLFKYNYYRSVGHYYLPTNCE